MVPRESCNRKKDVDTQIVIGVYLRLLRRCSSVVEHQPSKLDMWVRFPSPALCASGSGVEYNLAKVGVAGSNPVSRFFAPGMQILSVLPAAKIIDTIS